VEITFRRPSPFLFEALEAGIRKPGSTIGTGPFIPLPASTSELRANPDYYGGQPLIRQIHVETFPAVRTAWAKLLRNELDMLWEVGPDALSSLERSANVAVFTFTRRYQYVVALNTRSDALASTTMRRALNLAIDRTKLVADALNGHGVPSWTPVWPRYWALEPAARENQPYDPVEAARLLGGDRQPTSTRATTRFTLLIASDAVYERIALELKRQLEDVGIEMAVEAVSQDQQFDRLQHGKYEAVLIDAISGPTLLRPYGFWHSSMPGNSGTFGNRAVDRAFDAVREAETESAYRGAITNLLRVFRDDPPAVFLAWSVRARAISKRFEVQSEEGRDVLSTLRFWRPIGAPQQASRN
jgi:peptide/nickel transport system substrate-binding protein